MRRILQHDPTYDTGSRGVPRGGRPVVAPGGGRSELRRFGAATYPDRPSSRRRPQRISPATLVRGDGVDCEANTFPTAGHSGNLKSIEAPDASTVCSRSATRTYTLAQAAFVAGHRRCPVPHRRAADGSLINNPNGTGPYKFSSWDLDQRINLTANDAYWGTKALTPNLEFQWNNDGAAKFLALSSGAVDGIDNPGKDDLETPVATRTSWSRTAKAPTRCTSG